MTLIYETADPVFGPGREHRGTRSLQNALIDIYGGQDWGIYNRRKIAGTNRWSVHSEGRAGDIGTSANTAAGLATGDLIANALVANAEALGIQYVTWNHRQWGGSELNRGVVRWRGRGGNPHTDHVHYEQTRAAASGLTTSEIRTILTQGENDMASSDEILAMLTEVRDAVAPLDFRRPDGTPHNISFPVLQSNGTLQNEEPWGMLPMIRETLKLIREMPQLLTAEMKPMIDDAFAEYVVTGSFDYNKLAISVVDEIVRRVSALPSAEG